MINDEGTMAVVRGSMAFLPDKCASKVEAAVFPISKTFRRTEERM